METTKKNVFLLYNKNKKLPQSWNSRFLNRVKKRLTTYRSANPNTSIKFFSEINYNGNHIEYSFKNKFGYFRIGRSECYKLKFDIIYKHFLKFQHKFNNLHHFWMDGRYYLSEYYINKEIPDHYNYDLSDRFQLSKSDGFIPIVDMRCTVDKPIKEGNYEMYKIEARYLNIKKVNLKEYQLKYRKHLDEKWYGQQRGYANSELKKFFKENFKLKKIIKTPHLEYAKNPMNKILFKNFEKKNKSLIKKYPADQSGDRYWEQPEQRSISRQKSIRMMKKITKRFEENYNIIDALKAVSSVLPSTDPITYLENLNRIISGNDYKAPKELRKSLENINEEILNLIGDYSKRKKINKELKKQNDNKKNYPI